MPRKLTSTEEIERTVRKALESLDLSIWTAEAIAKFLAGSLVDIIEQRDLALRNTIDAQQLQIQKLELEIQHLKAREMQRDWERIDIKPPQPYIDPNPKDSSPWIGQRDDHRRWYMAKYNKYNDGIKEWDELKWTDST